MTEIPGESFGEEPITPRQPTEGMGVAVARRTVFRDSDNQNWGKVADRVAEGNMSCLWLLKEPPSPSAFGAEQKRLRNAIATGALLTSGRHLQHGDADQWKFSQEKWTNCSTSATSFGLAYLLLAGSGVGRSYDDDMLVVDWAAAPNLWLILNKSHKDFPGTVEEKRQFYQDCSNDYSDKSDEFYEQFFSTYVHCDLPEGDPPEGGAPYYEVEDSREGWAKAVEIFEAMAYNKEKDGLLILNFSKIRPAGSPIGGMQNRPCSGPISWMRAFVKAVLRVIEPARRGEMELWEQAMVIDHSFAEEVLVAGARRAARLAAKSWRDSNVFGFIEIKNKKMLWTANNSVMVDKEFWSLVNGTSISKLALHAKAVFGAVTKNSYIAGEPGLINGDLLEDTKTGFGRKKPVYFKGEDFESQKYKTIEGRKLLADLSMRAANTRFLTIVNPCFAEDTLIVTTEGAFPIKDLVGKTATIWDGESWQSVDNFRLTNKNQPMVKITLFDGSEIRVTKYHTMILEDGTRIQADALKEGQKLKIQNIEYSGPIAEKAAYAKGFLAGDGTSHKSSPYLWLYEPKYSCESRIIKSLSEIGNTENIHTIEHSYVRQTRKEFSGLSKFKADLYLWASEYKEKLPNAVFQWNYQSKLEFIAGLFDSDGTVMNSDKGFGYQLSSIRRQFLLQVQILLKSIGVPSKLSLMKKAGYSDIVGETWFCQDCYRLTISQKGAIKLASQTEFSRLKNLSSKKTVYNQNTIRSNIVVSVEDDGVDENVYCCTVDTTHSLALGVGILAGQCGEIALHTMGGFCVIADLAPLLACPVSFDRAKSGHISQRSIDLWDARVLDSAKLAARFLIRVNLMDSVYRREVLRTNRIGVSFTGIHEYAWLRWGYSFQDLLDEQKSKDFWQFMKFLSDSVKKEANNYSDELGVVRCSTVMTVKPSGSVSKLFGVSEGAHLPARRQYLRWVQFRGEKDDQGNWKPVSDPLLQHYEEKGYPIRQLKTFQGMSIVGFPTMPLIQSLGIKDKLVIAPEASPAEQYKWLQLIEKYWLGESQANQVSYTLKVYTDKYSLDEYRKIVLENQPKIKCCSLLPSKPDREMGYEYLPEEEISAAEFRRIKLQSGEPIDEEIDMQTLYCEGGACPI